MHLDRLKRREFIALLGGGTAANVAGGRVPRQHVARCVRSSCSRVPQRTKRSRLCAGEQHRLPPGRLKLFTAVTRQHYQDRYLMTTITALQSPSTDSICCRSPTGAMPLNNLLCFERKLRC
jgi:hypothetical protein